MNKNIRTAKRLVKIAKSLISSKIIKINQEYNNYDDVYEIDNNNSEQCFLYFDIYDTGITFYMIFDKINKQFTVNEVTNLFERNFKNGVEYDLFLDNLKPTNLFPRSLYELSISLIETISFYTLQDIFEKYNYVSVGEQKVRYNDKEGLRYQLEKDSGHIYDLNDNYDKMIQQIKEKANYPENVFAGGEGVYKYAPEIKRKSVIILQYN